MFNLRVDVHFVVVSLKSYFRSPP